MTPTAKRRLFLVLALLVAGSALGFISMGSMGENLVYYWDPTQLNDAGDKAYGATIRLGGMVEKDSLDWNAENSELKFRVTDNTSTVVVHVTGAPPQMFREGIGVVVEGTMVGAPSGDGGVFESDRLMVKHSNEYQVPTEGVNVEEMYKSMQEEM